MADEVVGSMAARRARTTRVVVEVPAEVSQLMMMRSLTDTVSLIAGLSLDRAAEIRVVVDEVATSLMRAAIPGTDLRCEFDADARRLRVHVRSRSAVRDPIDESGFAWHVIKATTDLLEVRGAPVADPDGGYGVDVVFEQRRTPR